jgi:hypothetical protein
VWQRGDLIRLLHSYGTANGKNTVKAGTSGDVAKHAAKVAEKVTSHSGFHLIVNLCGLAFYIALLIFIARLARRALAGTAKPANNQEKTPAFE